MNHPLGSPSSGQLHSVLVLRKSTLSDHFFWEVVEAGVLLLAELSVGGCSESWL